MPRQAVIFDMDGTLTRPQFDFDAIRREIGLPNQPILEALERMQPEQRLRAESILHRYECEFAASSELQPGAAQVLAALRSAGVACALMTRNSAASVRAFDARHGLAFDLVWTREDGPCKPRPDPVHQICQRLGVTTDQTWVVGDYLYDVQCGRAAGATTVLLIDDQECPEWGCQADHVIRELSELLPLMGIAV